jgi:hypothetical protein
MKIIQSYWSLPSLSQENDIHGRSNGGYIHSRFNDMSWALSCLTLRRFYKDVELITDQKGKELLIDTLKLPYTKVTVCLDELNHYHPKLWAIGKIKAYQLQKEPFLHVDGDIFIWKAFGDEAFHRQALIVQNMEYDYPWYRQQLNDIETHFSYIPQDILQKDSIDKSLTSINAGIIGGTDIDFFQQYTAEAFKFIHENLGYLNKINVGLFNNVFEQYLFYAMAFNNNKPIHPFLTLKPQEEFTEVSNFHLLPHFQSFIHLIGYAKRNSYACEQVEMRLRYEFPEYYHNISAHFDKSGLARTEQRYQQLKPLFDWMQQATAETILDVPLQLANHAKIIIGNEHNSLEFTQPYSNSIQKLELINWNMLIEAFENPICGKELLEVITRNTPPEAYEKTKNSFINFLMDKLVYDNILEIV